jgi:hypothetical protein
MKREITDRHRISALKKNECMRWGINMEQGAYQLSHHPECPEDEILVGIARISRICSDVTEVMRYMVEEQKPAMLHIKPLEATLDAVKLSLSPRTLSNCAYTRAMAN